MKQIIKEYLRFTLVITTTFIIICSGVLPISYIDNILFTILYLVIPWPLILLGIYKIVVILYNKIDKL